PFGPQRFHDLDAADSDGWGNDLRCLTRADEWTRRKRRYARHNGAQPLSTAAHLSAPRLGERTLIIASPGRGERFLVLGDGVADNEQVHIENRPPTCNHPP